MIKTSVISLSLLTLLTGFSFIIPPADAIKFHEKKIKFSKVDEGTILHFKFPFTNESNKAVIFQAAKVSCSCTHVEYPKSPTPPNNTDTVFVEFDTDGKIGFQQRKIYLQSNVGTSELIFQGVVKASEQTKNSYQQKQ